MECKKCGRKLKSKEVFCTECGYYNNEEDTDEVEIELSDDVYEEVSFEDDEQKSADEEEIDEFEDDDSLSLTDNLIKAYIGKDYDSIKNNIMNIFALFLSWIYFMYKKLYLIGFIGMILTAIMYYFFPKYIIIYIVVIMIASGSSFNIIYLNRAEKRVLRLKRKKKTHKEQKEYCAKKGGVNLILPLLSFAILMAFVVITSINTVSTTKDKFFKENSENKANCKLVAKKAYEILDSTKIEGEITEALCNITTEKGQKSYNIYFKVRDFMGEKVLYFENKDGKLTLLGNTEYIELLEDKEKNNTITEEEKDFLEISNNLDQKYENIKDESKYEKRIAEIGTNTKPITNYTFTKNDIVD